MKRTRMALVVVLACAFGLLRPSPSLAAGPYTDDLSKCLVRSTTDADKTLLVQWMFAMVTLHPEVKSMAAISDAERTEISKKTAGMFERLLTVSCQVEAQQAFKYEGSSAMEGSFSVLGQVAARELFSHPQVIAGISDLGKYADLEKLKKVFQVSK